MNKFMKVHLEMDTVVPQDLVELAGNRLVSDVLQGVANGELTAVLAMELASPDASLADVSPYMKQRWLDWLAENMERVKAERKRLQEVEVDDDNCLCAPFLVWDRGTPLSQVEAWFK